MNNKRFYRSLSPSAADPSFVRSSSHSSFDTHSLPRRTPKTRVSALDEDPTKVTIDNCNINSSFITREIINN